MTPIAQSIANDACLPLAKRRFGNLASEIGLFDDLHFFECSAIYEAARSISGRLIDDRSDGTLAFLPAPRTWIEARCNDSFLGRQISKIAFLIEETPDQSADVTCYFYGVDGLLKGFPRKEDGKYSIMLRGSFQAGASLASRDRCKEAWKMLGADGLGIRQRIYAILAMINTPRVIGRQQNTPHAGLQRKLAAAHGMPGKYPLRAWTELKLEVRPPRDHSRDRTHDAYLTGGKALHFCRCHLRIKLGKLELVTAHYRGDAALGIKQTRYAVIPPKDGRWPDWAQRGSAA